MPADALPRGFVEMRYAASFYDAPTRPLLRFWRADKSYSEEILPAPCEGAALWLGRVPKDYVEAWISPTNRAGRFDFRVEHIRPAPFSRVLARASHAPKRLFFALSAGLVGLRAEAELNWRFALGAEPLSNYPAWRMARRRAVDRALDRPRGDWGAAVAVLVDAGGADRAALETTRISIENQCYPNCRMALVDDAGAVDGADFVVLLRAGDRLEPHACACFIEYFSRAPEKTIVYADEIDGAGQRRFRPAWSPAQHGFANYVGRAACFRAPLFREATERRSSGPENLLERLLDVAEPDAIGALHRPLFEIGAPVATPVRPTPAPCRGEGPSVSIIVPTRDRVDLLAPCLESVLAKTSYPRFDVTVMDNDSAEPRTLALLDRLTKADNRLRVQRSPGPFNFAAFCNAGAKAASGEYLLFLNNDTQIVTPDWIERLLHFAMRRDVGAVGARLLYPGGRVQHVGVLLGLGGVAGHFGAGAPAAAPGWWGRNLLPHDVSAVTAACLLVSRGKFEAVGGYDEAHLPIELNDVDLCLRLRAKGWRTICNTQATLLHHESASRGGGLRLQSVYESERRVFCERWRTLIRDDPNFHPGLSLYRHVAALP